MKQLKKYILWFPLLMACNSSHTESVQKNESSEIADKVLINNSIREQLLAKDSVIINYLKAFNEIQTNLDSIKATENIITANYNQNEVPKSKKDIIINDIKIIYGLLTKNRETMIEANKELQESRLMNIEINRINFKLMKQVTEQESEIDALKNKLNKLNTELNNLNLVIKK